MMLLLWWVVAELPLGHAATRSWKRHVCCDTRRGDAELSAFRIQGPPRAKNRSRSDGDFSSRLDCPTGEPRSRPCRETGIEPRGVSSSSGWAMASCRPPRSRGPGRRPGTTTRHPGRCWSALESPPIAARVCGRADPTRLRGAPTWRTSPRGARHRAPPAHTNRPGAGACPGSRRAPFRVGGRAHGGIRASLMLPLTGRRPTARLLQALPAQSARVRARVDQGARHPRRRSASRGPQLACRPRRRRERALETCAREGPPGSPLNPVRVALPRRAVIV